MAPDSPLIYLSTEFIRAKEYLEAIVASTTDAICTTDMRGRIIYFSPGAEKMVGRPARDMLGSRVHRLYAGGRDEAERIMKLLISRGTLSNHESLLSVDGRRVNISMSAALLKDRGGGLIGTLGISKDITERVALERRLLELSITDNLTGLFNQRHFHERAESEVQRARRQRHSLSLILIDVDHFKQANDRWGHVEGDRILRRTGEAIAASIRREVDAAFRYGGDEFVVLLPGSGLRRAAIVERRIQQAAAAAVGRPQLGFSTGAAALRPGDTVSDLVARADARMYRCKRDRKRRPLVIPAGAGSALPPPALPPGLRPSHHL